MTAKSSPVKFGVLNMTICFQQPKQSQRSQRVQRNKAKIHAVPLFIPRYGLPKQSNSVSDKRQQQLSPYQRYHNSHKESLRYYREKQESMKKEKNLEKFFVSKNEGANQIQFNDSAVQKEERLVVPSRESNDGHLRLFFNKKHLRNAVDQQNQCQIYSFPMYPQGNPEQNLRNIFTVRTIKTSMRNTRKRNQTIQQKLTFRTLKTREQVRSREAKLEESTAEKRIRPWSPTRHSFIKENMFQSEIMVPLEPQQNNTQ